MKAILTPGEVEVAEQLLRAKQNPEIARSLGSTDGAVKMHLQRIWLKSALWGKVGEMYSEVNRVLLAVWIHAHRHELGVRCQSCGEVSAMAAD